MAQLSEVFAIEEERQEPASWSKIHLFKMGDFWRAYEWSAWLIAVVSYTEQVRMATRDRRPLHISRMNRTDIDGTYCFVGFPIKSLEKYVPQRVNYESVTDKHVVVTIALPQPTDGSTLTAERLKEAFEKWKEGVEMTKTKKEKAAEGVAVAQQHTEPTTGGGLLSQIMAYPLSERTAIENIQFISMLKQTVAAIL